MKAVRKQAFNRPSKDWRNSAYAAININWKKMFPDADRDDRLAWIAEYLGLKSVDSLTGLSDQQLGAVAGEMKRLTGTPAREQQRPAAAARSGNVVHGNFGRESKTQPRDSETIFLASHEQVFTLTKLDAHIKWTEGHRKAYLEQRYKCSSFPMLTFKQANKVITAFLRIAAHNDLKTRKGGGPVSRQELNKYIPILKEHLGIDQKR